MVRKSSILFAGWVVMAAWYAIPADGDDLIKRYPATIDYAQMPRGYDWKCADKDVWHLKSFVFCMGKELEVKVGPSQVVFGCHETNVLWAAVIPNEPGEIVRASHGRGDHVTSVWLRFHPVRVGELFPADTVIGAGDAELIEQAKRLAAHKMNACWQTNGRPIVPLRASITIDVETREETRHFYSIDTTNKTVEHFAGFLPLRVPKAIDRKTSLEVFDKVWSAFDREYAMFVVKPKVDWVNIREKFRPLAATAKDNRGLAQTLSKMLEQLEDLHVYVQVDGTFVSGYNRVRHLNASRSALTKLVGTVNDSKHGLSWALTTDGIGYITIDQLADQELPRVFDEVLQRMKDTRGLILDLRYNGGGSEPLARQIAGCFVDQERVYAMHQIRNGPQHRDLGPKRKRTFEPRDPWHYVGPVIVLQGERTMSSAEAFALMMAQCPQVTTIGDRTAGSSGNPKRIDAGEGIVVNLPQWTAMDADGKPFDAVGVVPDRLIKTSVNDFGDDKDPVLAAALKHLRESEKPDGEVLRIRPGATDPKKQTRVIEVPPADGANGVFLSAWPPTRLSNNTIGRYRK